MNPKINALFEMMKKAEIFQALVLTGGIAAFFVHLNSWAADVLPQSVAKLGNPNQTLEISSDLFLVIAEWLTILNCFVSFLGIITNLLAIYVTVKNNELALLFRLIATSESGWQLLYALMQSTKLLCLIFSESCPTDNVIIQLCVFYADYFVLSLYYPQLFITVSRYLAIIHQGQYFELSLSWPHFQLVVCQCFVIFHFASIWFFSDFYQDESLIQFSSDYILPTLLAFIIVLNVSTFVKIRKTKKYKDSPIAERKLMLQMLSCSFVYFAQNELLDLILIATSPIFGFYLVLALNSFLGFLQIILQVLGLSLINIYFLRKKKKQISQTIFSVTPSTSIRTLTKVS